VGSVQSAVAHVMYRIRSLSATEYDRRVVDHGQYVDRGDVLRLVRRPLYDSDTIVRHLQKTLPRKGTICLALTALHLHTPVLSLASSVWNAIPIGIAS